MMREPSIAALRDIVKNRQGARFRYGDTRKGVLVDLFTASAIVDVYDAVNETNKAKIERMINSGTLKQFRRVQSICLSVINAQK